MVLSGVFERYPKLKIILGHLGETLPFQLWRIDQALSGSGQKSVHFREVFTNTFWINTSGFFSTPALLCCVREIGAERILLSVDWSFISDRKAGVDWMKGVPFPETDKAKIPSSNASSLLKL